MHRLVLALMLVGPLFIWATPTIAKHIVGPEIHSRHALVLDEDGRVLYTKNAGNRTAIASITKLMTAMVVLDAKQSMKATIKITKADRDDLKNTHSRLAYGAKLSRREMLTIALSSSENRAAHALARYYPGGEAAFIRAMNAKAQLLGMHNTQFRDPTGLNPGNVSTARDLARLVHAALKYPFIRKASTKKQTQVHPFKGKTLHYRVTNRLIRNEDTNWRVLVSKTGYIREAGRCLVMRAKTGGKLLTIILLKGEGRATPYGDAQRIREWLLGIPSSSDKTAAIH
jgi:D-alanyl-D-alanine endopeptidase (penicillin-binding protein 7)